MITETFEVTVSNEHIKFIKEEGGKGYCFALPYNLKKVAGHKPNLIRQLAAFIINIKKEKMKDEKEELEKLEDKIEMVEVGNDS